MIEGPIERFRQFQGVKHKESGKTYVYGPANNLLEITDKKLRDWVVSSICADQLQTLEHTGVTIQAYENRDNLYIISLKVEVLKEFPQFQELSYNDIMYYKDTKKHLHNENGPAWISVEEKKKRYFWLGEEMTKARWEICVSEKKFNNKFDEWLEN